ncbi:hypothetical protein [Clostridium botulinum]|uniref:hypothetical protein n=1 Tax=Clostridium botulinum TaxID=1491 RepID=UPI0004D4AF95|nr:hypothetical protein [Clostridium botulinum]KEH90509.1 hypothetical protein Z963_p0066 [Clostridium botulinum C/D str. It1]
MELNLRTDLEYCNLGIKKTKGREEFTFCIHFTKEYTLESVLVYFFYDIYSRKLSFKFASKGDAKFDIKEEVYKLYIETEDDDFETEEYTVIPMTDFEKEVLKECKRISKESDFKIDDFEKEYCDKVREKNVMERLKLNLNSWIIQRFEDRDEDGLFHYYLFTHDDKILKVDTYRDDYETVEELEKKSIQVQLKDLKNYTDGFEINIKKLDLDRLKKARPILEKLKAL